MTRRSVLSLVVSLAAAGCALITGAADLEVGSDGVVDAGRPDRDLADAVTEPAPPPAPVFGITLDPDRMTTAEDVAADVTVTVTRTPSTQGAVDVSVSDVPSSVTVSPITIAPGATDGTLRFQIGAAPPQRTANMKVKATSGAESVIVVLPLVVTPNLFVQATAGSATYVVPASVTKLDVRAWGGGGGGGGGYQGTKGGTGGGGGFAQATISVTPGESLDVVVGSGGGFGPTLFSAGGGGGGITGLSRAGTPLVVAAGGGGGGGAGKNGIVGAGGGAGGGAIGQNGFASNIQFGVGGGAGTPSKGGDGPCAPCNGASLRGGVGQANQGGKGGGGSGGQPGGGAGGADGTSATSFGGGGGGAGFFGGGGGSAGGNTNPVAGAGGGGGSSYVATGALSTNLLVGAADAPGNPTDDYYANGAGAGGVGGGILAGASGKPGRIVIIPQ